MDAIIGKYRVRVEENGLILTHQSGISFDLTPDETLKLFDFIKVYRQALLDTDCDTEPRMERVVVEEHEKRGF